MNLLTLPTRTAGAPENMALDFLLLRRWSGPVACRFRHYDWRRPALTFGYSQKISLVRSLLPMDTDVELCRRPTGGGLVDHRADWTYALVVPRGHPWEEMPAAQSYRGVHEALSAALAQQQVPTAVKPDCLPPAEDQNGRTGGVCFQRAERYDVVHPASGVKIAGAAQKRTKEGLLFQGSIWRPATGEGVDWEAFQAAFTRELAARLQIDEGPGPGPEFDEDEVSGLTEQYASPEWLEYR